MTVTRDTLQNFWNGWLRANRRAERLGSWSSLAAWYSEEATYGWMYSPDEHFMALDREQIRDYAIGQEMQGLEGWRYDYQATVIDEKTQMIVGFWKQRSGIIDDETGEEYEVVGIGGSWFGVEQRLDRTLRFAWQRDWFDLGSTAQTFLAIADSGKAPQGLLDRMAINGKKQPAHYRLKDLPSTVWPPPVENGDFLPQLEEPE